MNSPINDPRLNPVTRKEATLILDHLESMNLLYGRSRMLADIARDYRIYEKVPDEAKRDPVLHGCIDDDDCWDFQNIMRTLRVFFMPQLAEVGP